MVNLRDRDFDIPCCRFTQHKVEEAGGKIIRGPLIAREVTPLRDAEGREVRYRPLTTQRSGKAGVATLPHEAQILKERRASDQLKYFVNTTRCYRRHLFRQLIVVEHRTFCAIVLERRKLLLLPRCRNDPGIEQSADDNPHEADG